MISPITYLRFKEVPPDLGLPPQDVLQISYNPEVGAFTAVDSEGSLIPFYAPPGGTVLWGSLGGTLSDQTDLQNALNARLTNITGFITAGSNITITGSGTSGSPYQISATGSGGGGTWGSITGTLSNQTDLQTALNAKAPVNNATLTGTTTAATLTATTLNASGGSLEGMSLGLVTPVTINAEDVTLGVGLTFNNSSFTYGTGVAALHRTALGLGTLATASSVTSAQISDATTGGNGGSDGNKAALFGLNGRITSSLRVEVLDPSIVDSYVLLEANSGSRRLTLGNPNGFETRLTSATPTATRTITLPDKTGTAMVLESGVDATGDIFFRDSGGDVSRLPAGTNGQFLTLSSGIPAWAGVTIASAAITDATDGGNGNSDEAKAVLYGPAGVLTASAFLNVVHAVDDTYYISLAASAGAQTIEIGQGGNVGTFSAATLSTGQSWLLPDKSGDIMVIEAGSDVTGDTFYRDSNGDIARLPAGTNGQALVQAAGIPSWASVVNSITGTANQVTASGSTGSITISLPQDIATASSPSFAAVTTTGGLTAGAASFLGFTGRSRIYSSADGELQFRNAANAANANITASQVTASSLVKTAVYTVATLPAAATAGQGASAFVSDANATTFASTVAGGGANFVPVYSDGANWKIG